MLYLILLRYRASLDGIGRHMAAYRRSVAAASRHPGGAGAGHGNWQLAGVLKQ